MTKEERKRKKLISDLSISYYISWNDKKTKALIVKATELVEELERLEEEIVKCSTKKSKE